MKKILIGLCLIIIGCQNSEIRKETNFHVSSRRIDSYGSYAKDNMSVSNDIVYLKNVKDIEKDIILDNESDFKRFYTSLEYRGIGDSSKYWRWKTEISNEKLAEIINKNLYKIAKSRPKDVLVYSLGEWTIKEIPKNPLGQLEEIKVVQRGGSGVIIKIVIKGSKGQYLIAKEGNIRKLFSTDDVKIEGAKGGDKEYSLISSKGFSMLPSAFFYIEKNWNSYSIFGAGFGHGVGLPQYAVKDLAKKGYNYKEIIKRYYEGVQFDKISTNTKIKVGITDSSFSSYEHKEIIFISSDKMILTGDFGKRKIDKNIKVIVKDKNGKIDIKTSSGLTLGTKERVNISSAGKIKILNIKRAVKGGTPSYRGEFVIIPTKKNKYYLVNIVNIEQYLQQVVPSEMGRNFGKEALKVQAVAARTYAMKDIMKKRYSALNFDILDNTQSQVYNNKDENLESNEAIKDTSGEILRYAKEIVDAKYFAVSSGITAKANNIW